VSTKVDGYASASDWSSDWLSRARNSGSDRQSQEQRGADVQHGEDRSSKTETLGARSKLPAGWHAPERTVFGGVMTQFVGGMRAHSFKVIYRTLEHDALEHVRHFSSHRSLFCCSADSLAENAGRPAHRQGLRLAARCKAKLVPSPSLRPQLTDSNGVETRCEHAVTREDVQMEHAEVFRVCSVRQWTADGPTG
jgi:hypothetical protein